MDAAFYRCEVKHIQRSKGRSVVAAAAYRARTRLNDERQGLTFEYGAKAQERLVYSAVRAPYSWAEDRQVLWNAAELAEKRCDAQTGTEILVGLLCNLTEEQNIELLERFVQTEFVENGFAVDFNYHDSPRLKGKGRQPHAHILRSKRRICADGLAPEKAREMDSKAALNALRKSWADHCNRALEEAGIDKRADHRALAVIAAEAEAKDDIAGQIEFDRLPEPKIGPVATQMVREGREEEAHSYADAMIIREDRYERIEAATIVRELMTSAQSALTKFPQHLRAGAAELWQTVQALMNVRPDSGGHVERERAVERNADPEIDAPESETKAPSVEPATSILCKEEGELNAQEDRRRLTSIVDAARSLVTGVRDARAARAATAAKKEAAAAEAALDRNLHLAEQAAFIGIDRLSPEADQSFANNWVRTIRSADGPMEAKYREADRVALRNYALQMDRYPMIGELQKVLIRLSPFAGGVAMSSKQAPERLPDGMKADFRDIAPYTDHVRNVMRQVETDAAVIDHLRETMRRAMEAEFRSTDVSTEMSRGRYARRNAGKAGPELGD